MSETKHTKGEASVVRNLHGSGFYLQVGTFEVASVNQKTLPHGVGEANAERLALCWNMHDELLAIAKAVSDGGMSYPKYMRDKATAALSKATT